MKPWTWIVLKAMGAAAIVVVIAYVTAPPMHWGVYVGLFLVFGVVAYYKLTADAAARNIVDR